jgi:fumarate reductase subunit D
VRGTSGKGHVGTWTALAHRVSGVLLTLFLPVHFYALGTTLESAAAFDALLVWTQRPLVKFAEWGIVVLLAAHLGGGLRVLALEFLPWRDWQKGLAAAAAAVALAAGLAFALAL